MLRPELKLGRLVDVFVTVARRCEEEGVVPVPLAGADPSAGLSFSRVIRRRGDELTAAVTSRLRGDEDIVWALNWADERLRDASFWSPDRLHMNYRGHHRVAARVLLALGVEPDAVWWDLAGEHEQHLDTRAYYRSHVAPWVKRRLTGRSSGDHRTAKHPDWVTITP